MATTTEQPTVRPDVTCYHDHERWTIVTDGTPWGIGTGVMVVDGWFAPSSRHSQHPTLAAADAYADAVHAAWTAGTAQPNPRNYA